MKIDEDIYVQVTAIDSGGFVINHMQKQLDKFFVEDGYGTEYYMEAGDVVEVQLFKRESITSISDIVRLSRSKTLYESVDSCFMTNFGKYPIKLAEVLDEYYLDDLKIILRQNVFAKKLGKPILLRIDLLYEMVKDAL